MSQTEVTPKSLFADVASVASEVWIQDGRRLVHELL